MKRDYEREHEPCPHCGRNACSWHRPGRICPYMYADWPGDARKKPIKSVRTLREYEQQKGLTGG